MALTWKDLIATVLAAGVLALAYVKFQGWQSWATAPRLGIVALALIGIGMCTLSSPAAGMGGWNVFLSGLGVVALLIIVAGLILGQPWLYYALAGDIVVLWLLSTTRHFVR